MIVFSDIDKLQELADGVPHHENEEIIALADAAKSGDESALYQLFYDLLPVFCSEYKLQAALSAKNSELLHVCLDSYIRALKDFDFNSQGESFSHHLGRHIRQARTDYIASCSKGVRIPIDELKKMLEG